MVFDFSKVDWINSRGIGICVTTATSLRNRNGDLKPACLNEKVISLLDKMRLFKVLDAYDNLNDALKNFAGRSILLIVPAQGNQRDIIAFWKITCKFVYLANYRIP